MWRWPHMIIWCVSVWGGGRKKRRAMQTETPGSHYTSWLLVHVRVVLSPKCTPAPVTPGLFWFAGWIWGKHHKWTRRLKKGGGGPASDLGRQWSGQELQICYFLPGARLPVFTVAFQERPRVRNDRTYSRAPALCPTALRRSERSNVQTPPLIR